MKFSSDFIIGYPNETNQDFKETIKLMEEVKLLIVTLSYLVLGREHPLLI